MSRDSAGTSGIGERAPHKRTASAVWLALIVALVGLLGSGTPPPVAVLSLIAVAVILAVSLRWRVAGVAVILLLLVGIALRVAPSSGFSDVLVVTEAAIREMIAGGNPVRPWLRRVVARRGPVRLRSGGIAVVPAQP